jgi:ring-1,2-phenylacetyl-CoA epoxidase subunit PaaE
LFDQAKVGDEIETIGASGFFTLPQSMPTDVTLFFIAAGSGITPIFSLLKEVLYKRQQKVVLIYSNRSERDTIFYHQLLQWQQQFRTRLVIHFLFSEAKDLSRARLNKLLLAELINSSNVDKSNSLAFLCGPHDYMQMARIVLLTENFRTESIRTEKFNSDPAPAKELPPDTASHQVTIEYQGRNISLTVKYPDSILQVAKRQGIELPYSCEAGRCGTCTATCLSGKIWMSRNEVLLDKEVEKGCVLICTGYAVGGDAQLVID